MIAARLLAVAGGSGSFVGPSEPPSTLDEEFDTALSGDWTTVAVAGPDGDTGANPGVVDADSTFASMLYMKATNDTYVYAYKAAPATPFTVTAFFAASNLTITHPADIALCVGSPTDGFMQIASPSCFSGNLQNVETMSWADTATFTNSFDEGPYTPGYGGPHPPNYLRWVVNSDTDVSPYWSWDNRLWAPKWTHRDPHASPAGLSSFTASHVIIAVHPGLGQTAEVLVDWLRFS